MIDLCMDEVYNMCRYSPIGNANMAHHIGLALVQPRKCCKSKYNSYSKVCGKCARTADQTRSRFTQYSVGLLLTVDQGSNEHMIVFMPFDVHH